MNFLKDEKGSAFIYLLWILTTVIVISLVIINITRVYVVKQQASTSAELGALAATTDILFVTEEAIKEYDAEMIRILQEAAILEPKEPEEPEETVVVEYTPLWEIINDRKLVLAAGGKTSQGAYIQALNEILPGKIEDPLLKGFFDDKFRSPYLSNRIYSTVKKIVKENGGNDDDQHISIKISEDNYRVEVITDATYNTITDGRRLASFSKDIPQKGYGPKLSYLKYVLN